MDGYAAEDLTHEQIAEQVAAFGPLADAVRGLVDATIRSEVDPTEAAAVRAEVEALTEWLRARQRDGSYGVRLTPEGQVHAGVSAMVLDQVLGEAAGAGGGPGMTGTLTIRYRRPTPLGDLHAEARIDRTDG